MAEQQRKPGRRRTAKASKRASKRSRARSGLSPDAQRLVERLSDRMGLSKAEVLDRALASYAAAVAPDLAASPPAAEVSRKTIGRAAYRPSRAEASGQGAPAAAGHAAQGAAAREGGIRGRLFVSIDGGPEREVRSPEAVIG